MSMSPRLLRPIANGLDPDVQAFAVASNATSLSGINQLAKYLKNENLWANTRFWPLKSSQNAGTGSTAYGLGGLNSTNMTLVNSPTWGSDGLTFVAASVQYGDLGDLFNGGDITAFLRIQHTSATSDANESLFGSYGFTNNTRSFFMSRFGDTAGDPYVLGRSESGSNFALEVYSSTDHVSSTNDQVLVAQWLASNSRSIWQNKQLLSLSLTIGAAKSSTYDSPNSVYLGAFSNVTTAENPSDMTASCFLFVTGTSSAPTTLQRERITDLINAL